MDCEATMMTLKTMLSQEDAYTCIDYILQDESSDPCWMAWRTGTMLCKEQDLEINRAFRSTLVIWAQNLIDYMNMRRETIEYAVSYFDRFLQSSLALDALKDRVTFQLAFVTCTYMAIKLHEPIKVSPNIFAKLCRQRFSIQQVEHMEMRILQGIDWRVNPPTAMAFAQQILALIPEETLKPAMRSTAYDLAQNQTDIILKEYQFAAVKKSTVALAGVLNALESLQFDTHTFCLALAHHTSLTKNMDEIMSIRDFFYTVIAEIPHDEGFSCHGMAGEQYQDTEIAACPASVDVHSPRSVHDLSNLR